MSTQQNATTGHPSTSPTILARRDGKGTALAAREFLATMPRWEFIARYVIEAKLRDLKFHPPEKP